MGGHGALNTRSEDYRATPTLPDDTQRAPRSPTCSPKRPPITNERTVTSIRHPPTTFTLKSEDEIDQNPNPVPRDNAPEDSSFGIMSIESNIADLDTRYPLAESEVHQTRFPNTLHRLQQDTVYPAPSLASPLETSQPSSPQSLRSSPLLPLTRESSAGALSGPLTPYHLRSPYRTYSSGPSSTPRSTSLRSLRLSDDDAITDSESEAVESNDGEDSVDEQDLHPRAQPMPTPELVMPSMSIPKRRPFTDSGRRMGKLTIAVIGRPGKLLSTGDQAHLLTYPVASGKKSLLRAIVQSCEDIVHVDAPVRKSVISHTTASTRFYPSWWSEIEGTKPGLRRRPSGNLNEAILERNIAFVVASTTSADESASARAIIQYIEERFARNLDLALLDDGEILSLLSGNGAAQVDLVLYILPGKWICYSILSISKGHKGPVVRYEVLSDSFTLPGFHHGMSEAIVPVNFYGSTCETSILTSLHNIQIHDASTESILMLTLAASPSDTDIESLADLSKLATVVPVLGQTDTLSEDEIRLSITSIQQAIRYHGIDIPNLNAESYQTSETPRVWPVSSATFNDDETMDASFLMNSGYIQPLAPSGLPELVHTIFNPDHAARLRHLSARKFLAWLRARAQLSPTSPAAAGHRINVPASSALSSPSASQVLVSRPKVSTVPSAYTLTRWAADLQRSLRNERDRYQRVPSEDRRGWLVERWRNGESAARASDRERDIGKAHDIEKAWAATSGKEDVPLGYVQIGPLNHCAGPLQDPLGLLACDDMIRRNGTIIARILGGSGVLGAIALWAMKTWGWGTNDGETGHWTGEWGL